ncbi:MAG: hypothetical protein AB1601_13580 [Planctomycetota bacterium]
MVRRMSARRPVAWTAALAIAVAGAGLVWHLLACVESPMAYSPSGDSLAFVTVEPWDPEKLPLAGECAYRLMVLKGEAIRVVEQTTEYVLSGPAYSPDGRRLCYLRIPMFTREAAARAEEARAATSRPHGENTFIWPGPAGEGSLVPPNLEIKDETLPRWRAYEEALDHQRAAPRVRAALVVRDVESGQIVSSTAVDLPLPAEDQHWALAYAILRPQYSPDGRWVYLCDGHTVLAVDPTNGAIRLVVAATLDAALSPDGTMLATLSEHSLALTSTDGQRATYLRWDRSGSYLGLVWRDKNTLAVLEPKGEGESAWLHLVKRDGTLHRSCKLAGPTGGAHDLDCVAQLAVAPNGSRVVVAFEREVLFLSNKGRVLRQVPSDKYRLAQPTFSPDSKRVAFKRLEGESDAAPGYPRAAAIAFFTPDGRELAEVPIPSVPVGTTRPAAEEDE